MDGGGINDDDDVVIDHDTPVWIPIGVDTPGPIVDAPLPNYGIFSSNYHNDRNELTIGDEGQIYATDYSYRPVVRGTLRRLKTIGSNTLNEFDKGIILNSVSSSNVTSHELFKVTFYNDLTKSTIPNFTAPRYTIHPDNQPELQLPLIPPTLRENNYFNNLFEVDVSSANPTTPQGTASSTILPTTATKRRLVSPDLSSSDAGQLSSSLTPAEESRKRPLPTTAIRQAPRAYSKSPIGMEQVIPVKEVVLSAFPNLTRNPTCYARPIFMNIPLIVASDYLLCKKHDTLPDNSSQRPNLIYDVVLWRSWFTRPPDNMFIRIEEVHGWETCRQKLYADFPRNSDGVIQLFRNWQLENPFMVKLRELILDVGEHGKEEVLTLLKDAGLLDEVWAKTHNHPWYVEKTLALHKKGETCYPGCPFCKSDDTLFTGAIHCDGDHKKLEAQQQKKGTRHTSRATGLPGRMVQPSLLNKQQHEEQEWGIHPTCASRHELDTHWKMRNGKGDYNFRYRLQYAYLVVLVLHVNGYTCKHTGVEITWDTYTAFDTEHQAMGMNVMIDGEEFPTRKIMCISEIWNKSWGSFAEFFDALCREVTVTYVVNRMAHRLIGYGHHEKRCHLFPDLPSFPFEKVEIDSHTILKPLALPPVHTTTRTTSTEAVTTSTTITSSTINVTTATTTNKSTTLKSITKPVLNSNELVALKAERVRVGSIISGMKEESTLKRKREEDDEEAQELVVNSRAANTAIVETKSAASSSLYLNQLVMYGIRVRLLNSVQIVTK